MIRNFFTLAIRNLLKNKQTTLISIAGLVIAFSVILQIGNWCSNELSYDKFQSKADRIYRFTVEESRPEENFYWHFARCWQPWRTQLPVFYPEIETLVELRPIFKQVVKADQNSFYTQQSFAVDSSVFNVFDFNFIAGNSQTALNSKNTVVISESFANKLFPATDALNKSIELPDGEENNNEVPYTITGIYRDMPENSHFHAEMLVHYEKKPVQGNDFAFTYILLKKGTSIDQITNRSAEFIKTHVPENQQKSSTIHYTPITDIHLKSHIEREIEPNGDIKQVKLFAFVGLGMLFIALINFINLLIASLEKRSKYFNINVAIGARQKHNAMLLIAESLCIATVVILISLLFFKPVSILLTSAGILSKVALQTKVLGLLSISLFALVVVSGVLPLLIIRIRPSSFFTKNTSTIPINRKISYVNHPLLVLQFVISIVVIISSLMLNKQNRFLFSKNLGHNNGNIVMLPRGFWAEEPQVLLLKEELMKNPVVQDVSLCMDSPGYLVKDARHVEYADIPEENKRQIVTILPVDANFFSFFNLPLVAGSEKAHITNQNYENYILNESAIKKLGFKSAEEAIGTRFKLEAFQGIIQGGTIVGVVKDFNFTSLYSPIEPTVFFSKPIWEWRYLIKLTPGNKQKQLAVVRNIWNSVFPEYPFDYEFLEDTYAGYYQKDIVTNKLLSWFSAICIILSSIGLLGIASLLVVRKTKEIGVRKVNGAKVSEILTLLNKDFVKWVIIAFMIATPLAWYAMHKWLENFAYKTELSWWIFALAGLLALGIALLTVSWQSWRAATKNPVEALRYE